MSLDEARQRVLELLRREGKAKNSRLRELVDGDESLLNEIREDLLFEELAEDVRGVGLRYTGPPAGLQPEAVVERVRLFLSYGRRDAKELADRLSVDLAAAGYDVWQDTGQIHGGTSWQHEIVDGLRSAQLVIALMTPHSVRTTGSADNPDNVDSVCLGEIAYALFNPPTRPVVPVMVKPCEPPLAIFHLDYVDMRAWSDSPDQYQAGLQRLLADIEAARRGERRYRSWYHQLNPFDFAAFLHPKRQDFCGRQWLFDRIDAWRVAHQRERALLITGNPGTGKSAIVAELVHRNPGGQVLAYHCCQWDVEETLEPWRFIRSMAAMIASKVDDYAAMLQEPTLQDALSADHCRTKPESALEEGVLTPLQRLPMPKDGPRYLLIDALDEALLVAPSERNVVDLLASRLDRFPPWLKIVATTRNEAPVLNRLRGLRAEEIDAMSPDNLADIRQYIAQRLDSPKLAEPLAASRIAAEQIVETLCGKSSGNFLWVQQALDGIERDIHQFENLDALPPGLAGLYELRFARQFPDAQRFATARQVLDVVVAAREPLTRGQIAAATGLDEEEELPAVLKRLSAYVPARAAHGDERRYAAYHKSLVDWLADPERRDETHSASPRRGHQKLAAMGWAEYQRGVEKMSPYAVAHLPAHLIAARRWDDLESLLIDIFFLESKNAAGRVFDLAGDFSAAVEALPEDRPQRRILRLLDEALRRDIHFIARHAEDYPQGLFQCLWNTCWWYDCDEAAAHYENRRAPGLGSPASGRRASAIQVPVDPRLCHLLEHWREAKQQASPGFVWLRARRSPPVHLDAAQRAVLRGHKGGVNTVSYRPDGRRIVSGSRDKTVRVWDAESGAELAVLCGHESGVASVSYSPDGRRIVSGSADHTVRVWEAASGTELAVLRGHENMVRSVSYSPDGRRIVSGSADNTVRVWDAESGAELVVLRGHEDWVRSVSYRPDGRRIVSGSGSMGQQHDNTIRVWDAQSGIALAVLHGHEAWVQCVSYSPDGHRIVSGSADKTVRVWDAESGTELAVFRGHEDLVWSVSYSPDGRRIISGSADNTVRVWDAESGTELVVLRGHEDWVRSVSYCLDGRQIVSGSADTTVRVWDTESGAEVAVLRGHKRRISSVVYSPDGRRVVSRSEGNTVRVWDAETGAELAVLCGHEDLVQSVSYSPDGRRIASGSDDKTARVWDAESGVELAVLRGHEDSVHSVSYDPDGRRIISRSGDKTVRVWDAESGAELAVLRGHEDRVSCVSYSPDGRRIVSGSDDKTVRVWDAESGAELAVLLGHKSGVSCISYSPDGRRIVSGSGSTGRNGDQDKTVRVWDAESGTELVVLRGHEDLVWSVSYSPDGRRIVSESWKSVRVWDAESGECLEVIEGDGDVRAIAAGISAGLPWRAISRDGETVIEPDGGGVPVGRFAEQLSYITTHPTGRTWAGTVHTHLHIISLEG
jgi:WD40 repeat protein